MNTNFNIWTAIRKTKTSTKFTVEEAESIQRIVFADAQGGEVWERLARFEEIMPKRAGVEWFICEGNDLPWPVYQQAETIYDDQYSRPYAEGHMILCEHLYGDTRYARPADAIRTADGEYITMDLYHRECGTCASCGGVFYENNLYYRERRDETYCEDCDPGDEDESEDESEDGPIYTYSTRVESVLHRPRLDPKVRYFGLELEQEISGHVGTAAEYAMDNIEGLADISIWKSDGSINSGAELVTLPKPMDYWRGSNPVQDLCDNAEWRRTARSHNTTTCGLHIHVSRSTVPEPVVAKVVYLMNEPSMADLIGRIARRPTNSGYCAASKKRWHSDPNVQWRNHFRDGETNPIPFVRPASRILKTQMVQSGRYTPVNLTDDTLEFRVFRGTLRYETILASVEFCDAAISFCATHGCSQLTGPDFRAWLQDLPRKVYPALKAYAAQRGVVAKRKDNVTGCDNVRQEMPDLPIFRISASYYSAPTHIVIVAPQGVCVRIHPDEGGVSAYTLGLGGVRESLDHRGTAISVTVAPEVTPEMREYWTVDDNTREWVFHQVETDTTLAA